MQTDPVEAALLAAIEQNPEDPSPYLVYADWLQDSGHLRGELVALQGASDDRPGDHRISDAAIDHIRAHAEHYLGSLATVAYDYLGLTWRCGFISRIELTWAHRSMRPKPAPDLVLRNLLQLESARFVTDVVVESTGARDLFIARVLAAHAPPTLRRLWIGPRDPWSADRDTDLGDLEEVWRSVPNLLELGVHGRPRSLGAISLPALRRATFLLETGVRDTGHALVAELARAHWPELEALHLAHGHSTELQPLAAVLERTDLVTLGELAITNCPAANELCKLLTRSPLAPQLNKLSLVRGALTDEGAGWLLNHHDAFPSLIQLDLSDTFVTPAAVARLRDKLGANVIANDLRTGRAAIAIRALTRVAD